MSALAPLRSLLFVPGDRPELFAKAALAGADALVLDLEDSVTAARKEEARAAVAAELARPGPQPRFIRINPPRSGDLARDLSVLAPRDTQAVMVPKVEDAGDLEELDTRLAAFERAHGLERDAIAVLIVVETSLGLRNLYDTLVGRSRVRGAGLATAEEGDLMLDLGGHWTPDGTALSYARGKLVCDARAAGAAWVIDGAFMNLNDDAALDAEANLARTSGFNGKVAIHPRQVARINSVFTPTTAEITRARRIVDAYRSAQERGRGATAVDGVMVDRANLRWAERILAAGASMTDKS
ncbi:MAG: HpcH/HpaI aldolase/citrate lyase family protein [Steroidobacteraceae bacterium]